MDVDVFRADRPRLFSTRWAMSYLRGPLTKDQVAALTTKPPEPVAAPSVPVAVSVLTDGETTVAPPVAPGVPVSYLDVAAPWATQIGADPAGARLRAFVAMRVSLRYDDTAADLDETQEYEALFGPLDSGLDLGTETAVDFDDRDFRPDPVAALPFVWGWR